MIAEKPKTVQIDISAHAELSKAMGNSREIKGSLSNLIRWACRQDADIRSILFDGVTPEAEIALLELVTARAKANAKTLRHASTTARVKVVHE